MYRLKLERFEGPLDLLLQLIERRELDISDVSLSAVTEQYLSYLETNADLPPEDLADFIVVAAKLLLLKSRILLPNLFWEDEEDSQSLTKQLSIYRAYVRAGHFIRERLRHRHMAYARERAWPLETGAFSPPRALSRGMLRDMFERLLHDLAEFVRPMPELVARTISLTEKIAALRAMLAEQTRVSFADLVSETKNRMEIIVTFLALLELIKQRHIVATQSSHGGTITLVPAVSAVEV